MKKLSIFLTLAILICLLAACGSASPSGESASSKPEEPSQSTAESTHTDILYAVFSAEDVKEYPIEYTGAKKTAEELAQDLSELTGLDFIITASKADDGWIVDWAADSTLIAGLHDREQKEEFHFFDQDSLSWFMMDSLWRTLTENLNAENIYYTMDGGRELVFEGLYPVNVFPFDIPYMGSEFYFAHADVRGDEENPYDRFKGFWEYPDGTILEINFDEWNLYTADDLTLVASGPVEYDDEEEAAYLMNADGSSGGGKVYFDEDGNLIDSGNVLTYRGEFLSDIPYMGSEFYSAHADVRGDDAPLYVRINGFWEYPDGTILEIDSDEWYLYTADDLTLVANGPVEYDDEEEAVYLMNADGSSGGGKVYFDEDGNLIDSGNVLTYHGESL